MPLSAPIRVACRAGDGALAYAIALPPERLPPVLPRDLLRAWDAARAGATQRLEGPPRSFLFAPADTAEPTEITLADRDARCWAEAIDRLIGLDSLPGLTTCLRLLALIEVLARAPALSGHFALAPRGTGISLHPALLAAAAHFPLDSAARFDAAGLARLVSPSLPAGAPA